MTEVTKDAHTHLIEERHTCEEDIKNSDLEKGWGGSVGAGVCGGVPSSCNGQWS